MQVVDAPTQQPFITCLNLITKEFTPLYDERFSNLIPTEQIDEDMLKLKELVPDNLCKVLERRKIVEGYRSFFTITYLMMGMVVTATILLTVSNPYWMLFGLAPIVPGAILEAVVMKAFQRKISPLIVQYLDQIQPILKERRTEVYHPHKLLMYIYYKGSAKSGRSTASIVFVLAKKRVHKKAKQKHRPPPKKTRMMRLVDRLRIRFPAFFRVLGPILEKQGWYVGEEGTNDEKVVPVDKSESEHPTLVQKIEKEPELEPVDAWNVSEQDKNNV
jgi:hypothetical protein